MNTSHTPKAESHSEASRIFNRRNFLLAAGIGTAGLAAVMRNNIARIFCPSVEPIESSESDQIKEYAERVIAQDLEALRLHPENIEKIRQDLLQDLWRSKPPLPVDLSCEVVSVDNHAEDWQFPDIRNIAIGMRLCIEDPYEEGEPFTFQDHYYRCKDESIRNNRLMIVHQGHGGTGENMTDEAVNKFILNGFDVLYCQMPLFGNNTGPESAMIMPSGGGCRHLGMHSLATPDLNPMKYLYGHISTAIAQVKRFNGSDFDDVSMCGISGGGMTTMVYSALDTQIQYSFPIAGTLPYPFREKGEVGCFDREDELSIFRIAPAHVLYALACVRPGDNRLRTQVLMYNMDDPSGPPARTGFPGITEKVIAPVIEELGGDFRVLWDPYSNRHHITYDLRQRMLQVVSGVSIAEENQ